MKKTMTFLSCIILIFSLCACVREEPSGSVTETNTAETGSNLPDGDISARFDAIEAANTYENLIAVNGSYKYTYSSGGEQSAQEKYYDGVGTFITDIPDNRADYFTENSYYVYRDGKIQAYLDVFGMNTPTDPSWAGSEFISDYAVDVQSIEKTDSGYLITFAPNEEDAQFFLDNYAEGDGIVIREAVNENLTLSCIEEVVCRADGTEEPFSSVTLTQAELPQLGQEMRSHATPTEENKAVATVVLSPGTDSETRYSTAFTKGDDIYIETFDFKIYDDPECTIPHEPGTEDTSGDITIYALPPEITTPAHSEYRAYDAEGNELYHEILWLGAGGEVLDSDITEAPEGAEIAYADYVETDENGNELYSQRTDFSMY